MAKKPWTRAAGSIVTAENVLLFQRLEADRAGGPWFGNPIRGFGARTLGPVQGVIYYLVNVSGLAGQHCKCALEVESPGGRKTTLNTMDFTFGPERVAKLYGNVGGFDLDGYGDYAFRLICDTAVIARTWISVYEVKSPR